MSFGVSPVNYSDSDSDSDIILKYFKLSFQHLDRFCTGGQLEIAVVVLINGDYNVNFHRERKPAKMQLDVVFC